MSKATGAGQGGATVAATTVDSTVDASRGAGRSTVTAPVTSTTVTTVDAAESTVTAAPTAESPALDSTVGRRIRAGIRARYRRERRFRRLGAASLTVGALFLLWLLGTSALQSVGAFTQTFIALDITLDPADFAAGAGAGAGDGAGAGAGDGVATTADSIAAAPYNRIIKSALRAAFPAVTARRDKRQLYRLISDGAQYRLRDSLAAAPGLIGGAHRFWLLADDEVDLLIKGRIDRNLPESDRRLSDQFIGWVDELQAAGRVERRFNRTFFTAGDSRDAEQAGILGAVMGSLFTLVVTMLLAVPVGIAAAVYLQEFAPRNRFIDLVEVNINNLAAVPSITFGLLGLALLINFFGMPRSLPLVGGMVLALMTLPTIIISSRAALAAVPPRIRQAALALGASRVQAVVHHVLPLALPGMLTGAIIGLAQALGETAPLLAIGMVAFIVDIPGGPTDPATALPVQIYLWADSPERAFVERTAAAIVVLLAALAVVNGLIAALRNKVEKRW